MDKRILSSSASGYIIISGLPDSTYNLFIGFPKNEWPEQNVTIKIKEADAGFILKNLREKGWGLINLQTMQLLAPEKKPEEKKVVETELATDAFSSILAAVVNDPAIAYRSIVKNETLPAERSLENKTEEKLLIKEEAADSKTANSVSDKPVITKLGYDVSSEGINIVYLDMINGVTDTVKLFIPAAKPEIVKEPVKLEEKPKQAPVKDESKKDARFIDMELQNPNLGPDSNSTTALVITEKKLPPDELKKAAEDSGKKDTKGVMINSDCKNLASRDDFLDLRKQMVVEEDYDNMIKIARKFFKKSCFTTEQIKNLGSLFLKDEGKYKFYYAAYPFVSDTHNFSTLENQLTDNYFITKFKAMQHR